MNIATYRDRVATVFKARPNEWIDGVDLEKAGGKYAWRSRVSDCRTDLGMDIQNKQVMMKPPHHSPWLFKPYKVSLYRYVPAAEPQPDKFDANQPWQLSAGSEAK